MKPTLFAIAIGCLVLAGIIPTTHAAQCAGGVRPGCAKPHRTVVARTRTPAAAGPTKRRTQVTRGDTAAKRMLTGCNLRATVCHRRRAHQVAVRGAVSLDALSLAHESPENVVDDFGTRALAAMRNADTEAARQNQFRLLYRQYFDEQASARSALGSYWQDATAQQRQEFVDRYEDYIVIGYSGPLGHLGGESFTVLGTRRSREGAVIVASRMNRIDGAPIEFDWQLTPTSNGYKVTNVIVSGIDMGIVQRSDIISVIQRNSGQMQSLLTALRDKNASNGIIR